MAALQSILVPVDGSGSSLAALDHAVALAEDSGATIEMLYVESPDPLGVDVVRELSPSEHREIERLLEDAFDRAHVRLDGRVTRRTVSGDPMSTIVETAREGAFDLIVMGTHGRVGRLHSLLGSVAEGVVRNAPCPVLTVREAGGGYQSFAERRHGRPSVAEPSSHHPR